MRSTIARTVSVTARRPCGAGSHGASTRHVVLALDPRPELAQALVDPLVAAVDLADVADLGDAVGANAAISIAMPARMSGDSTRWPCSRRGPTTIARCGSQIVIDGAHQLRACRRRTAGSRTSTRGSSPSPAAWVASASATLVRSAGNAGHGPSCTLGVWSPLSLRITSSWLPGTITSAPRTSLRRPEPVEHEADHPQVLGDRVLDDAARRR